MLNRTKKIKWTKFALTGLLTSLVLLFASCSNENGGNPEGINVIWVPLTVISRWFFGSFTPGFWTFVETAWHIKGVGWLAGIISNVLGGALYLVLFCIAVAILIVLGVILGVVWFLAAIANGIFHFV